MFVSFAQYREDVLLNRAFADVAEGFYVDVGANDPVADSVTKAFYERGWRGVNVEPVPSFHEALARDRPRDICLNLAAGRSSGKADFSEIVGTGLSTTNGDFAERAAGAGFERRSYQVAVEPLSDILSKCDAPSDIHFMSVDVEGAEADVLAGMDFSRFRPQIIVIEAVEPNSHVQTHEAWQQQLFDAGYEEALYAWPNRWYVAKDRPELKRLLSVAPDEYVLRADRDERARLERELSEATGRMAEQARVIAGLERAVGMARAEARPLTKLVLQKVWRPLRALPK